MSLADELLADLEDDEEETLEELMDISEATETNGVADSDEAKSQLLQSLKGKLFHFPENSFFAQLFELSRF